ncbi:MAG: NAD-binding protein [Labilithrix sp.]|nr:NAD-binding protein [Labilithrix sp.]MCW5815684.1 NAD-binding protein [Labilithrix sp.]
MRALTPLVAFLLGDKTVRRNLRAFAKVLLLTAATVTFFSIVFHFLMLYVEHREYSWVTSFYWTLTVMSTLGFGDITFHTDVGRLFSVFVLLTGLVMFVIVLPFAFIRFFYAPWLEAQLRLRVPRELPRTTSSHVIICRYDTIARDLVERLAASQIPYVVIESDPAAAAVLQSDGVCVVLGEYDSRASYVAVGAERARLVFANLDDATNTNIALTVREQAAAVPIAALAESDDAVDVLELSGASTALPLKRRLGEHLAARVNAGHTRAHVVGRFRDLVIAELPVHGTGLAGRAIRDTSLRALTGLTIVAFWEGGVLRPAHADAVIGEYGVIVVVGSEEQVTLLDSMFVIYTPNENPVVVIGGGRVGVAAAAALRERSVAVHLIEKDAAAKATLEEFADEVFIGDASDRAMLMAAGLASAPSVVLTTNDDATNIFLAIYCRRLNPHIRIVSRITHERNLEAIHRAGADSVLSYSSLGVKSLLALLRGHELVLLEEGADVIVVPVPPSLADKTLGAVDVRARTGLNVIALQDGDEVVTNPTAATRLPRDGEIIAIGSVEQRAAFVREFAR